jgi:hypothetical protein
MTTISTTGIDATKPEEGQATTASVRDNFAEIKVQLNNAGTDIDGKEPADATILKDADIGVSVQAYDATYLVDADIGVNVEAYDATILKDADIGVTVQAYGESVQVFDTVALMKAESLAAGETVMTRGYYTKGDGGGATYLIVAPQAFDGYIDHEAANGNILVLQYSGALNVKWAGAKGDGSDATASIQAALDYSLDVYAPQGNYSITATLVMRTAGRIIGSGAEKTIFQRNTNFGDTLQVGDISGRTFAANDFVVKDIWFYRPFTYVAGTTTTIDNPVTAGAAAINVYGGQRGLIDGCFFSAMPYNVIMEQTSLTTIKRNTFNGIWDADIVGLQEGLASIYLKSDTTTANTLNTIDNNHISGGFFSASKNVTIGSVTFATTVQIGAKVGVLVNSAEGLNITNNYLGGHAEWSVKCHTNQITAGIKISDNFFDAGLEGGVQFETQTASYRVVGAQIHDNYFNGQLINKVAINSQYPASLTSVASLEIANNIIENFTKTPIGLNGADGVDIDSNIITAYDSRAGGVGDADYAAGIRILSGCALVRSTNNKYGGGTNGPSGANNCKWGIVFDSQASGYAENEHELFLGAANPILVQNSGVQGNVAVMTAAGNYAFVSPVDTLLIRKTVPAATQVTPPTTPFIGQVVTIKDSDGVAAANAIQIVGTVDGAVNPVYAVAYNSIVLMWNGAEWDKIG